jgi:hypothetical protein
MHEELGVGGVRTACDDVHWRGGITLETLAELRQETMCKWHTHSRLSRHAWRGSFGGSFFFIVMTVNRSGSLLANVR